MFIHAGVDVFGKIRRCGFVEADVALLEKVGSEASLTAHCP